MHIFRVFFLINFNEALVADSEGMNKTFQVSSLISFVFINDVISRSENLSNSDDRKERQDQ